MKRLMTAFLLLLLASGTGVPIYAQMAEWERLNNEARLLYQQGRYERAAVVAKKALQAAEQTEGPNHTIVAACLDNLARLYRIQGQYSQAEPLYKRSLAIYVKALGSDHPDVAMSLNSMAMLYKAQGQYAPAETLYKQSLLIREKALGPNHPDVATSLNNLASLYDTQGLYSQAEPLHKRSLAIREKALGPDSPDIAMSLNNLASLYQHQGQYMLAEQLYQRALVIYERALGPDHPTVATIHNNLAALYAKQGQPTQAAQHYINSLKIREKKLGPNHLDVAASLNNIASLLQTAGRHATAELLYKRSLAIREKALGPDHHDVAGSLNNLAVLYKNQGQFALAEPLYKRSFSIAEKNLGSDHPHVAMSLSNLAALYDDEGQYAQALSMARRSSAIYRRRIVAGGTEDASIQESAQNRTGFFRHLSLLSRNPGKEPANKITDESFQIVQLEQASGTASAIAKMASRFSTGDDALADLVKRKQDATDRHTRNEAQVVNAASKPPQERNAADEQRLRDDIARVAQDIVTIDAELTSRFPEYQELTRPEPVSVSQIQALLKQGEAMLVYELGSSSFLWAVRRDGADFLTLQLDAKDIAKKVATVRAEMEFYNAGNARRVSVGVLSELYDRLVAPALPYLTGIKHVMVVPAGPLVSLPFSMLIASPPPEIKSDADYRKVDWLARHYAISVLPSVSSIQAFRQFAKAGKAQEPFAGFGDPLIGGTGDTTGTTRGKRASMDVATVFRGVVVKAKASTIAQVVEIADVEAIRKAPRLPETANELRAMAKALKSGPKSLWLQENATETKIKRLDLSKYRTVAFATHGLMAGEIKGIGEPGLILTPPQQGTLEDDGYLSGGEIAKLKLNADWVVLSACNTASADGTPGAEGLSGLAKAFFYAGARSLLVSHWPVASEATVPLTTGMLKEYEANPGQGKAEAHRKAMLSLIDTPNHPEYANPLFWAPFVVVGEGGAGSKTKAGSASR